MMNVPIKAYLRTQHKRSCSPDYKHFGTQQPVKKNISLVQDYQHIDKQTHPNHYLSSSGSLIEKIECIQEQNVSNEKYNKGLNNKSLQYDERDNNQFQKKQKRGRKKNRKLKQSLQIETIQRYKKVGIYRNIQLKNSHKLVKFATQSLDYDYNNEKPISQNISIQNKIRQNKIKDRHIRNKVNINTEPRDCTKQLMQFDNSVLYLQNKKIHDEHNQIDRRFHEIENILISQNSNLKKQNNYLLTVIKKLKKNEQIFKMALNQKQQTINQLLREKIYCEEKIVELQQFLQRIRQSQKNIGTQKIVSKYPNLSSFMTNMQDKTHSCIKIDHITQSNQHQNIMNINISSTERINDLNNKFQKLIKKYRSDHNDSVKKQCIQIAKQIKNIKNTNKRKILQTMSSTDRIIPYNYQQNINLSHQNRA